MKDSNYIIEISPQAHEDIKAIREYILKDGRSIADKQANLIYDGLENIAVFPNAGIDLNKYVERKTDYRFFVIDGKYLAFYKVSNKVVRVSRIFRGEQDYITLLGLTKKACID